ncbi:MAG: D-glycero-beta-D-manno-heptose-1,7-bisphosphate 7-phosphatase [Thaumarchaeota archaeon]|jgi:D,D-heptose 1,7-bisphosphate phosphatase|nr:MAG: D-glycero-beta-D-manno-heptose-1,7-bisphosphate 7-phosphatase [Nitrososphaerota archaeon]
MKAIFLDRDGVINQERKDYVKNLEEFKIFDDVGDAISLLKKENFLVVIITNQSAINRNLLTLENLNKIHECLKKYLKKYETNIDAIYYCPHTPKENCSCRKPKPGLLLQAADDLNIDLKNSWMIGDSKKDIDAAKAAGCNSILLKQDQKLFEIVKEFINNHKTS